MENISKFIKSSSFWKNFFKTAHEKSDLENVILAMPPFTHLNSKYLKLLMTIVHNRAYNEGEYIFYHGDPGIGLYIIREGSVNIVQADDDSGERVVAEFVRGDFFGDMALLEDEVRSASAVATADSKLAVIFKPDLDEFVDRHPPQGIHILRGISQIIASRLRILNRDYNELSKNLTGQNKEQNHGTYKKDTGSD